LTYLSVASEGLAACYVTGGLAGLTANADDVYRRTYPRVAAKTKRYYDRYPQDRERIGRIADFICSKTVMLPDGDQLSVRRLQTVGIDFGMAPGSKIFTGSSTKPSRTRLKTGSRTRSWPQ
jgi:hypothetical protein